MNENLVKNINFKGTEEKYNINIKNVLNNETMLNLLHMLCIEYNKKSEYNITPDFIYIFTDTNKLINFTYIDENIKIDKLTNNTKIDEKFFYYQDEKCIQKSQSINFKNEELLYEFKNLTDINYICLLDYLDKEEYTCDEYYGIINKYWAKY